MRDHDECETILRENLGRCFIDQVDFLGISWLQTRSLSMRRGGVRGRMGNVVRGDISVTSRSRNLCHVGIEECEGGGFQSFDGVLKGF